MEPAAPVDRPLQRDLVAIGASAGGVEALKTLVTALPGDLPATVLVALHLPASARSSLADILARSCAMPVRPARPDLPLVPVLTQSALFTPVSLSQGEVHGAVLTLADIPAPAGHAVPHC